MTPSQRKIKSFANILAVILVVIIFLTVALLTFTLSGGISLSNTLFAESSGVPFSQTYGYVEHLEIDVSYSDLKIATGEAFTIHATNGDSVKVIYENNSLYIEDVSNLIGSIKSHNSITVYIPESTVLKSCELDSDFSDIDINTLKCNKFKLETDNGTVTCNYLSVIESAEIESGTGSVSIKGSDISNLSLESGVGSVKLEGRLKGVSEIEGGVGKLELALAGTIADYTILGETGAGKFTVDNKEYQGKVNLPGGSDTINITGGLGVFNINFN